MRLEERLEELNKKMSAIKSEMEKKQAEKQGMVLVEKTTLKKEKKIAERLSAEVGLPIEKTLKMIRKSADAQEKADAAMAARLAARKADSRTSSYSRSGTKRGRGRGSGRTNQRRHRSSASANPRGQHASSPTRHGSNRYSSSRHRDRRR